MFVVRVIVDEGRTDYKAFSLSKTASDFTTTPGSEPTKRSTSVPPCLR